MMYLDDVPSLIRVLGYCLLWHAFLFLRLRPVEVFPPFSFFLFDWWFPLLFLVRNCIALNSDYIRE
jgi:hypothetical protein